MLTLPKRLKIVLDALVKIGARPIFVGGYVRDALLNLPSKDIDIEVHKIASLEKLGLLLEKFGSVNYVGKSFGVLKFSLQDEEIDFSLPRRDSKISSGHRGFIVDIAPNLSFKEAARRRDFTINAMGYDYVSQCLLDPFEGSVDLEQKVLREVDAQHFDEDPLRVYRALQFASRFEFRLSPSLGALCQEMIARKSLDELARERIYEEYTKLLLKSKKPSIGIKLLDDYALLGFKPTPQTLKALDNLASNQAHPQSLDLMFSALLYQHHNPVQFLEKLSHDKKLLNTVQTLLKAVATLQTYATIDNYTVYKLSTIIALKSTLELAYALDLNKDKLDEIRQRAVNLNVLDKAPSALIQGRDLIQLGLRPSKAFKEILDTCYEAQLHEEFFTPKEANTYLIEKLLKKEK